MKDNKQKLKPQKLDMNKHFKKLEHEEKMEFDVFDKERAALWDKSDFWRVEQLYGELNNLSMEIGILFRDLNLATLADRYPADLRFKNFRIPGNQQAVMGERISVYQNKRVFLVSWLEEQLERRYRKETTRWADGHIFEPLELDIFGNKLTGIGLDYTAKYLTGESVKHPVHIAAGIGTRKVEASDRSLVDEKLRGPADYFNANGNVISSGRLFEETMENGTYSEFGAYVGPNAGDDLYWRAVITDPAKRLIHTAPDTRISTAHITYIKAR